ncbi:hypothetical protein ACWGB8_36910 [Kitasatospora sp. NPDC054939]
MPESADALSRRWALASAVPALLVLLLAALGATTPPAPSSAAAAPAAPAANGTGTDGTGGPGTGADGTGGPGTGGQAGGGHGAATSPGAGLSAEADGYRLESPAAELPAQRTVGYPFTVIGRDGRPVTGFTPVQTKPLHFYAIRSDLTGYQHVHPAMAADGTWNADLAPLAPGDWRLYAAFSPADSPRRGSELVLSRTVTVPGAAMATPLPPAAGRTTVDGYTVDVRGEPMPGWNSRLTVAVSRDGVPVTDLEPYLESYAHLSAFHEGDLALAHLHPLNAAAPSPDGRGGPELTFHAMLGRPGNWRLFLQFQTEGRIHTATVTLDLA